MIDFNENDFKLTDISREAKLFNLVTRYRYRVYGLRQEENPPILIEYHFDKVDEKFGERLKALVEFFKANGISVDSFAEAETNRVDIGLRRDLRAFVNKNDKPLFAASILSTIVYSLEGRVDLEQLKQFKLRVTPTLPPSTQ